MYLNNLNIIKIIPKLSNKKPTSNHSTCLLNHYCSQLLEEVPHPPDLVVLNDSFLQKYSTDTNYSILIVNFVESNS